MIKSIKFNRRELAMDGPEMRIIATGEICQWVASNHGPDTIEVRHADGSVTPHQRKEVETVED